MPLTHLTKIDGGRVALADVDLRTTEADFGLPPAEIAAIIADVNSRADVPAGQITASMAGSGAREIYLALTHDYARDPRREIAALLGTMRHAVVNIAHNDLSVETRVTSKDGRFSAKYDSYIESTGDLRDAKFPKSYKLIRILDNGAKAEARAWVLQLNLAAIILREQKKPVLKMTLDVRPSDLGMKERREFKDKFGIEDASWVPVPIPNMRSDIVKAIYSDLHRAVNVALDTEIVPPMCTKEETWGGKKCVQGWCPVAERCAQIAQERGEPHPLLAQMVVYTYEAEIIEERADE